MELNKENISRQGSKISDLLPRIEAIQQLSNALLLADNSEADRAILQHQTKKAFRVIFDLTEQLYQELDSIAYQLLECSNNKETGGEKHEN